MKEIPLTRSKVAIVDDEDYEMLILFKWNAHYERGRYYALSAAHTPPINGRYSVVRMHRLVAKPQAHQDVDHIDGDGLNNQKCNLRNVTRRENLQNLHIPKSSRYPGVCFDKPAGKWLARIRVGSARKHIGHFAREEDAFVAYMKAVEELEGAIIC